MNDHDKTTTEQPIQDIDAFLGYWLRFVSNQVTNAFQQKLATVNITIAEWLVLRFLWSNAPCSSTAIAEELVIDKGVISRISDRLEKRKLIKRKTVPADRRLYSIELTAAGRSLVPELSKIAAENDTHFFSHLSQKETANMMNFLKDMVNRWGFKSKPID